MNAFASLPIDQKSIVATVKIERMLETTIDSLFVYRSLLITSTGSIYFCILWLY